MSATELDLAEPAPAGVELAYVAVEVSDVDGLSSILNEVVGLVPGESVGDARTWRNDARVHRIIVTRGDLDDVAAFGFEFSTAEDLIAAVQRVRELGFDVTEGSDELRSSRKVDAIYRTVAPWGTPIEMVVGLSPAGTPFESALVPRGFKTAGVGFGHAVVLTTAVQESERFVTAGLGLERTDSIELEDGPAATVVRGTFFHGNPRHHTLALIGAAAPRRMDHIMVETHALEDVGAAFDRALARGVPVARSIGQHDNDRMVSFYLETPAGFQIEVGFGGVEVGPDWDDTRVYRSVSAWGHHPLPIA